MNLLNLFTSFKHIIYQDEEHTYMNKSTNIKYTSSTGVVKQYTGEFDTEYWVRYKTLKNKGISLKPRTNINVINALIIKHDLVQAVEQLRQEWKDKAAKASEEGSGVHEYMSHAVFNKFGIKVTNKYNKGKLEAALKFVADHPHLTPVATEFIVGTSGTNEDMIKVAGMIDLIVHNSITKSIEIYDYKTNAKLELTNPYEKMKPPYNDLQASTYNKFRLQLSIYKYLLESNGVAVSTINIVHLKEDGTYKLYKLKPIKNLHFHDNTQLNLFN